MTDVRLFLLIFLTVFTLSTAALGQAKPSENKDQATKPFLQGTILWQGKYFKPREVLWPQGSRGKNMILERMLIDKVVTDRSLIIGPKSKGIANCAIVLDELEVGTKQAAILVLSIKDLAFSDRLLFVRPGGRVRIQNKDPLTYRFMIVNKGGPIRDFELGPGSTLDLDLPEDEKLLLIEKTFSFLRCVVSQPGWSPVLATTEAGNFDIHGLKPGLVKLTIWHEKLGHLTKTITVAATGPTKVSLTQADFSSSQGTMNNFDELEGGKDPVLIIEGEKIGDAAFQRILKFVRTRYDDFALPESTLRRYVIKAIMIPLVASLAHHAKEIAVLKVTTKKIDDALGQGKTLAQIELPPGAVYVGTNLPWVTRRNVEPWLGSKVFAAPKNLTIGPFYTATGVNYILVTAASGRGEKETRQFQHLFVSFRPELTFSQLQAQIQELSKRARVEALDPALESSIPAQNRE